MMHSHSSRLLATAWAEHINLPLFVLDANQRVSIWNQACEAMTGIPANRLLGTSDYWMAFYEKRKPCLADVLFMDIQQPLYEYCVQRNITIQQNSHQVKKLVFEEWKIIPYTNQSLYLISEAVPVYDQAGQLQMVCQTLQDVTDLKRAQSLLQQRATTDTLTGLATRRTFEEQLSVEWQRAQRQELVISLVMMDVNGFRHYNEECGHEKGDEYLKAVAIVLQRSLGRLTDIAARYGGDEFVLLLPGTDTAGAMTVAERVSDAINHLPCASYEKTGQLRNLTVSFGVATQYRIDADNSMDSLVSQAEQSMREMKNRI